MKQLGIFLIGLFVGGILAYIGIFYMPSISQAKIPFITSPLPQQKKEVLGFLPYWLLSKAKTDYSSEITSLVYFSLTVDTDGSIKKLLSSQETEPGWYSLSSGKVDENFMLARKNNISLALTVFDGDNDSINQLVSDPITHARNLIQDLSSIMQTYHFSALNLDIESTQEASKAASQHFTQFVQEIKKGLSKQHLGTLSVDMSTSDFIKPYLIDPKTVGNIADTVVIMAYDYHSPSSYVTGPVAPLNGAGSVSEYDVQTVVTKAKNLLSSNKIILGIPLYGYEWETIGNIPRSAVIPGTGITASSQRVEQFLSSCSTCSVKEDPIAKEKFLVYQDPETNTYHQLFYPDLSTTQSKLSFATQEELAGVALWALGYESSSLMTPLSSYKQK